MVNLITNRLSSYEHIDVKKIDFELNITDQIDEFNYWWNTYKGPIQLDTETNIVVGVYGWKGYLKGINKDFHEELDANGKRIPCKRVCYLVQVGDLEGKNQWLFEITEANPAMITALHTVFLSDREKLIHNGLFDYTTIKWCFGIDIDKIRDTFLISQILTTGLEVGEDLPKGYHSLAGCAERILNLNLSKEQQTTFNGDPLTIDQIKYAAIDVTILGNIYKVMMTQIEELELYNVVDLECSLIRSYGDGMCENLYLDSEEWSKTMVFQQNEVIRIESDFYGLLKENINLFVESAKATYEEVKNYPSVSSRELEAAIGHVKMVNSFIQLEDKFDFKWSSPKLKKQLIKLLFEEIQDNFKVKDYQDFVKAKLSDENFEDTVKLSVLRNILSKDFESAQMYFIKNHLNELKELEVFVPKDTVLINLNSPIQKLHLFSCIKPGIESTNKDVIAKIDHPLAKKLKEYNKASKMATSYGQNFLNAVNPDGMFRISGFKQILNTGRSSMDKLQLLPGQAVYRNPFKPNNPKTGTRDDGHKWVVVGADYASQEAVVAATFCQETSLIDAIEEGCDFHSTCASLMFPEEWKRLGGDPKPKGKPEDKTLQKFRNSSKVVSFGLFYGKSAIGLGESLNIPATTKDLLELNPEDVANYMRENIESYQEYCKTYYKGRSSQSSMHDFLKREHKEKRFLPEVTTADDLIDRFYGTFPNIYSYLTNCAEEAVKVNFIKTSDPIQRIRFFAKPNDNSDVNSIRRAAQNFPIQGELMPCINRVNSVDTLSQSARAILSQAII
jgi:DNA polymerase I-like protein with 3'-5' exonuclease and polymerase domains